MLCSEVKVLPINVFSRLLGKEVFWTEVLSNIPDHIRVHYDRERYLSDYEDFSFIEIVKLIRSFTDFKEGDFVCTRNSSYNNKYKVVSTDRTGTTVYDELIDLTIWLPFSDFTFWECRDKDNDRR